jgi:hypothetical protein
MESDVVAAYRAALVDLGDGRRWYQTSTDLHYAAAAVALSGIDGRAVRVTGDELLDETAVTDPLRYVTHTVAAVASVRHTPIDWFVGCTGEVAHLLRSATRTKRTRRIAAAIVVLCGGDHLEERAARVAELYGEWNRRHRILTVSDDLVLAAVVEAAGVDGATSLERADFAFDRLAAEGYSAEWELARILALKPVASSVERFLWLAHELHGRRRKPLPDRRPSIAIAALSDHPLHGLHDLIEGRVASIRQGRFGIDRGTALQLAALLTMGESLPAGGDLHGALHGLLMLLHHRRARSDASSS